MFDEKKGPTVYCRLTSAADDLAEEWAERWDCHKHQAINSLVLIGAMCAWFVLNMAPSEANGQAKSRSETEALLNKIVGPLRNG